MFKTAGCPLLHSFFSLSVPGTVLSWFSLLSLQLFSHSFTICPFPNVAPPPGFACPSFTLLIKLCLKELMSTVSPDDELPYLWLLYRLSSWTGRHPHRGQAYTLRTHELQPLKRVVLLLADGVTGFTLEVTQAPKTWDSYLWLLLSSITPHSWLVAMSHPVFFLNIFHTIFLFFFLNFTGFSLLRFILNSQLISLIYPPTLPPPPTPKPIHQVHFLEALLRLVWKCYLLVSHQLHCSWAHAQSCRPRPWIYSLSYWGTEWDVWGIVTIDSTNGK